MILTKLAGDSRMPSADEKCFPPPLKIDSNCRGFRRKFHISSCKPQGDTHRADKISSCAVRGDPQKPDLQH